MSAVTHEFLDCRQKNRLRNGAKSGVGGVGWGCKIQGKTRCFFPWRKPAVISVGAQERVIGGGRLRNQSGGGSVGRDASGLMSSASSFLHQMTVPAHVWSPRKSNGGEGGLETEVGAVVISESQRTSPSRALSLSMSPTSPWKFWNLRLLAV